MADVGPLHCACGIGEFRYVCNRGTAHIVDTLFVGHPDTFVLCIVLSHLCCRDGFRGRLGRGLHRRRRCETWQGRGSCHNQHPVSQQHSSSKACCTVVGCSPSDQQQLSVAALHVPVACCSMLLSLQLCLLQLPPGLAAILIVFGRCLWRSAEMLCWLPSPSYFDRQHVELLLPGLRCVCFLAAAAYSFDHSASASMQVPVALVCPNRSTASCLSQQWPHVPDSSSLSDIRGGNSFCKISR